MTLKQNLGFLLSFVVFCIGATFLVYLLGGLSHSVPSSVLLLFGFYLVCGVFMYRFIKEHPSQLGEWFQ